MLTVVVVVVVVVCVFSIASSFRLAEIARSSSVILLTVSRSSSTLVAIWLSFSLSLFMLLPQALKVSLLFIKLFAVLGVVADV